MKSLAIAAIVVIISLTASATLQTGGVPESAPEEAQIYAGPPEKRKHL